MPGLIGWEGITWGYATIEGKQMPVLLDTGANVNMITPECVVALGLQMGPLTDLHEGGITIDQPFNYEGKADRIRHHECADRRDIWLQQGSSRTHGP